MLPDCMMACGLKPKRPITLIKSTLPKTLAIVLPITPEEYFLKRKPKLSPPIIPEKTLIKEIKVSVINLKL